MVVGEILRGVIIIVGILLFWLTITSLAKRKMTETFCLIWGGISVAVMLAGVLLRPVLLEKYISTTGLVLVSVVAFCIICGAYFLSTMISELTRKNQELAIQVSLLKRESEKMLKRMEELEGMLTDEKDINHN